MIKSKPARRYYAAQSPRGFVNEVVIHIFSSRRERDAWVSDHASDGAENSAYCGAYTVTAKEAREILSYRGDASTESFNGWVDHDDDHPYA